MKIKTLYKNKDISKIETPFGTFKLCSANPGSKLPFSEEVELDLEYKLDVNQNVSFEISIVDWEMIMEE